MNIQMRRKIDQLASAIQKVYRIDIPIDDMEQVVKTLGGSIEVDSNVIDGKIQKTRHSFKIILGNYDFNSPRNRFTIAHELGHLFLHMGYKIDVDRWEHVDKDVYNRLGFSQEESQANEFAAAFLMPSKQFYAQVKKETEDSIINIPALARYFQVSQLAAINRAKFLEIVSW